MVGHAVTGEMVTRRWVLGEHLLWTRFCNLWIRVWAAAARERIRRI